MNEGLSDGLKTSFPGTIPVHRPLIRDQEIRDPNWLAGFTSGEGSFMIKTRKSSAHGYSVLLVFKLSQHRRDLELMRKLADYLDCGHYYPYLDAGDFTVTRISDITDKIIPFFDRYPISGAKAKDFEGFKEASVFIKSKAHLTKEGLDKILLIKSRMNFKRESIVSSI